MNRSSLEDKSFLELQRRIRARLLELNEAPTTLAERHGLGRDYIRDFLYDKPRRRTVRSDKLGRFASALDCDEEYLTLRQREPRKPRDEAPEPRAKIAFGGRTKVGSWNAAPLESTVPLLPSVTAPGRNIDVCYIQGDDTLTGRGILAGALLYAERGAQSKPGDIVILRRTMGPLVELSTRIKRDTGVYELAPAPEATPIAEPNRSQFREVEEAVVRIAQTLF